MKNLGELAESTPIEFVRDNRLITLSLCDDSNETVSLITKWRINSINWYDSNFIPTKIRTKKWLQSSILNCVDRILFLIIVDGRKVGHIGLDNYNPDLNSVYIMSVVKGESVVFPRLMEYVGKKLIDWIFFELNIPTVKLRVFSDNYKAMNLNERMGMLTINSTPMMKKETSDGFIWEECGDNSCAIRYMNDMIITKDARKKGLD
jgi:RimJ/RimL family protein N-acetyltransferase